MRASTAHPTERVAGMLGRAGWLSLRFLLVAGAIAVSLWVVVQLRLVVLPVIAALFVTTLLVPPVRMLRRRGWPALLATLLVVVVGLVLIGGVIAGSAVLVAAEIGDLGEQVREGFDELIAWLAEGPLSLSRQELEDGLDSAIANLRENAGGLSRSAVSGALLVGEIVAGGLLAAVLVFFFVKDGERLWTWIVGLWPARQRQDVRALGDRIWTVLTGYIRGLAIVGLVDAVLIGIALIVLDVPLVPVLMVLTFLGAFLPIVGAFLAGLIAVLVTLVSVGPLAAVIILAVIIAVQQIEGDLIYPLVVGRALELHPVPTLLALTAGAALAGIVGAFLAVPVAAVLWAVVSFYKERRDRAEHGRADGSDSATGPAEASTVGRT